MKIRSIEIRNFRGIREVSMTSLDGLVVLAGQNGSGKSCVLDAIRLLKSIYGGSQKNEYNQWFAEFQINLTNDPAAFRALRNDQSTEMLLEMEIELHEEEKEYLSKEADDLVRQSVWRTIAPESYGWSDFQSAPLAAQYRSRKSEVDELTDNEVKLLKSELRGPIKGSLTLQANGMPEFQPSKVLEIVFSFFRPEHIGVIDYNGPNRSYTREGLQNIN